MKFLDSNLGSLLTTIVGKIILAIIVLIVGNILIKFIVNKLLRAKKFEALDPSVRSFARSGIKIALYAVLIVIVIGILGIPMASVIAVLASAGLAIGLALQGALSNFAGGIMIMIFKPFRVGDYVSCPSGEGVVSEITLFYTKLLTVDNKMITVPNSGLMNSAVTNFSSEELRRVDLDFSVAYGTDVEQVKTILLKIAQSNDKVKTDPAPVARVASHSENSINFTFRSWCESADYWDVYFDLMEKATAAFAAFNISVPTSKMQVNVVN